MAALAKKDLSATMTTMIPIPVVSVKDAVDQSCHQETAKELASSTRREKQCAKKSASPSYKKKDVIKFKVQKMF